MIKFEKKTLNKILLGLGAVIIILIAVLFLTNNNGSKKTNGNKGQATKDENGNIVTEDKVDIIDVNSNTRPFAIVVNNTPCAVAVQEGLNNAYIVYELPTEGATSRLMALFKDVNEAKVGTIRSARHNFIDYAQESNAILVAYGWSEFAERELRSGVINHMNGMVDDYPFWRENPEGLASEHTAYTSLGKIREYASQKGYSLTGENTNLLKYNTSDVDLSDKDGVITANHITIPYGNIITQFEYDGNGNYNKIVNSAGLSDYYTKELITTKNIIVEKIGYDVIYNSGHYAYWDLHNTGTGDGYFITNGKAVPIKWSKPTRSSKTTYTYLNGEEIEVSDGRTYIEVQVNSQPLTIE